MIQSLFIAMPMMVCAIFAKTIHINSQTTDIAIGNRKNLLTLDIARLDIDATMKVPGTGLTKIASKLNIIVNGTLIFKMRSER